MSRSLYVFGSNGEGQLGIPVAEIVTNPTKVSNPPPLASLRTIRCGDNHTLFQTEDGTLYGVGDNRKSHLAPRTGDKIRFAGFENLQKSITFVAATCKTSASITVDHAATQSWITTTGSAQWGELGRGNDTTSTAEHQQPLSPLPNPLPGTVVDFAAGVWHYVAVLSSGCVFGWGKARLGQLGQDLSGQVSSPTQLAGLPFSARKAVCGKDFTYLAGDPATGEHILLGRDKFNIASGRPQHITGWKDIGATWHAVFVLFADGTLAAWGKQNMWQLVPPGLPRIAKIAVGADHVLAVSTEGTLLSWGWGKHGNCGNLAGCGHELVNDMVSGFWNEIHVPGQIEQVAAGYCTSFVVVRDAEIE